MLYPSPSTNNIILCAGGGGGGGVSLAMTGYTPV